MNPTPKTTKPTPKPKPKPKPSMKPTHNQSIQELSPPNKTYKKKRTKKSNIDSIWMPKRDVFLRHYTKYQEVLTEMQTHTLRPVIPCTESPRQVVESVLASADAGGTASLLYAWIVDELVVTTVPSAGDSGVQVHQDLVVVKTGRSEVQKNLGQRVFNEVHEVNTKWRAPSRSKLSERVLFLLVGRGNGGHEKIVREAAGFPLGKAHVDRDASRTELAAMLQRDTTLPSDTPLIGRKMGGSLRVKDGWRLFLSETQTKCSIGPSEFVIMHRSAVETLRARFLHMGRPQLTKGDIVRICEKFPPSFGETTRFRLAFRDFCHDAEHGLVFKTELPRIQRSA